MGSPLAVETIWQSGHTVLAWRVMRKAVRAERCVGHGRRVHQFHCDAWLVNLLKDIDAIVVPGGFGNRGVNGKITAIQWAREKEREEKRVV